MLKHIEKYSPVLNIKFHNSFTHFLSWFYHHFLDYNDFSIFSVSLALLRLVYTASYILYQNINISVIWFFFLFHLCQQSLTVYLPDHHNMSFNFFCTDEVKIAFFLLLTEKDTNPKFRTRWIDRNRIKWKDG